jgi:MATE family multidrug resistance protein
MELETPAELKKTYWNTLIHSVVTFMGQSLMQLVDLLFCGKLGSHASATVGTATSLYAWFMIIGIGVILSLEYWIPHSLGEKDETKAHSYYYSGVLVAVAVSLFSAICFWLMGDHTALFGVNPEIQSSVASFSHIIALSYLPVFIIPTLRVELQARGYPHDTTYAFIFGNILNVFLNWSLISGRAGMPELGLNGCAWANLISRFGILFYLIYRVNKVRGSLPSIPVHWKNVQYKEYIWKIIHMGLPTSLHMLFEMGAFILVSMLASQLSNSQNAAHVITISIASFLFMIPLGLGSAAALTLSKLNGGKRFAEAVKYGKFTIRLGLIYASVGSIVLILFREPIFKLFTQDPETIKIGSSLLFIAALFQLGDASQVVLAGCLRGFGQTKIQAIINAIGHWVIGLPLGLFLGYQMHMEILGFWIGLSSGLFSVALGLYFFWLKAVRHKTETQVEEVQI